MQHVVAIFVAFHVLMHGTLGCCDHVFAGQSHDSRAQCGCDATLAKADAHEQHEAADCHLKQGEQRCISDLGGIADGKSSPWERHNCPHDSCHWLTSDAAPAINFLDLFCLPAFAAPVTMASGFDAASQLSPEFDIGQLHALALRLHLAVGVLLI